MVTLTWRFAATIAVGRSQTEERARRTSQMSSGCGASTSEMRKARQRGIFFDRAGNEVVATAHACTTSNPERDGRKLAGVTFLER
jgi:hypothetical protein